MITDLPELPRKATLDAPPGYRILRVGEVTAKSDMYYSHGKWFTVQVFGHKITAHTSQFYARKT